MSFRRPPPRWASDNTEDLLVFSRTAYDSRTEHSDGTLYAETTHQDSAGHRTNPTVLHSLRLWNLLKAERFWAFCGRLAQDESHHFHVAPSCLVSGTVPPLNDLRVPVICAVPLAVKMVTRNNDPPLLVSKDTPIHPSSLPSPQHTSAARWNA